MNKITFDTANNAFAQQKYQKALDQFCYLEESKVNPALSAFMAGKCSSSIGEAPSSVYMYYKKALEYDDSNALINREIEQFVIHNHLLESKTILIGHYFPNTTNIGDSGSAAGIRAMLNSQNNNLFFTTLSCRKDTIEKLKAYKIKFKGIIIGGGGLFFHQPLPSYWYFPLSFQQIQSLTIPKITYAIGFNKEHTDNKIWNLDSEFIKKIAHFHSSFTLKSVRDNWTKVLLEKNGVKDLKRVNCPSAFLKPLSWLKPLIPKYNNIVGISITDRSLKSDKKNEFFSAFYTFSQWLLQSHFTPLFIFQDSADDLEMIKFFAEKKVSCIMVNSAREAITIYNRCSYVVGMRGHSLILAAGQCVPICAISYNKKVDAFMEILELQNYCINQNIITCSNDIITHFIKCVADKDTIIQRLKSKQEEFYKENIEYCKSIIDVLHY